MLSEDFPALLVGVRAGALVARYRLEEQVGAGGMAVVFRVRDERLGRQVALKILAPSLAADPAFRRRFIADVLWSNPSGSVLIGVASLNGNAEVGVITADTFTPLHGLGPEDQSDQGAW